VPVPDDRRVLLQFPLSHYCEKTRWHLDLKGLSYGIRNVLPGPHVFINRRLGTDRTVPVLIDGVKAIGDSSAIALHLEERYSKSPLVPASPAERARVLELEEYFDETFGVAVRAWAYGEIMRNPGMLRSVFFRGYGPLGRLLGYGMSGVLGHEIRRMYCIDPAGVEAASRTIDASVERLEQLIDGDPDRYLVGNGLTLADVTAASLLAPIIAPPASPWPLDQPLPASFAPRRAALRARPAGKWVLNRYAKDRPAAAAP
jgi:glutathione S-transferase